MWQLFGSRKAAIAHPLTQSSSEEPSKYNFVSKGTAIPDVVISENCPIWHDHLILRSLRNLPREACKVEMCFVVSSLPLSERQKRGSEMKKESTQL